MHENYKGNPIKIEHKYQSNKNRMLISMHENYKGNPIKIEHKYQCMKTTRAYLLTSGNC